MTTDESAAEILQGAHLERIEALPTQEPIAQPEA